MSRWRRRDAAAAGFPDVNAASDADAAPVAAAAAQATDPRTEATTEATKDATTPEHEAPRPSLPLPWPPLVHGLAGFSLRPWGGSPGDADALARAWTDPDVVRWTKVPSETDVDAARKWIAGDEQRRERGLSLDLAVAPLEDPEQVIGEIGLVLVEPARLWAEVGYWLVPSVRGAGLGATALRLFSDWAVADLPVKRLFARTHPDNPASAGVAKGAGFDHAGELDGGISVWVRDA
jgi:RimJ/RimL family protein N-acetyltransferase